MKPETVTSDRLLLRPLTPDDTDAVHRCCADAEIRRWIPLPEPYGHKDAEDFVERIAPEGWRTDTAYTFGVFALSGGPLIGAVNAHRQGGAWEVGYWTAKEQRGRGHTAEAVGAVARWAFGQGIDRLEWRAESGNTGSRAVAEKAGFVMEGTLRAALLHRGSLRDVWIGSLLPSDIGLAGRHPYLPAR